VLWDLAGALLATGSIHSALLFYHKIITEGISKASACPHGEGEGQAWAVCLIIDSLFMAGVCRQRLGHKKAAIANFVTFLQVCEDFDGCVNGRKTPSKE
jgi:hypothetical protein